ncbi:MAG: hypothetical protein J7K89_02255 [Candidatus Cloacimonetes bacterium]|nr:hypothetical protein [Candidatus Cloacimonadota bacterium]
MKQKEKIEVIEPEFWQTLSEEQRESVRHIAKRYNSHEATKKFINVRFNFWLFKSLFLVFIIGEEKRADDRLVHRSLAEGTRMEILRFLFYTVLSLGVVSLVFILIYILEVYAGVDVVAGVDLSVLLN